MFMDIPIIADVLQLRKERQAKVDERLLKANAKRKPHDYKIGEEIYVKRPLKPGDKLHPRYQGPFPIIQVHTNGMVTVRRSNGIEERVNIRCIKPKL